MDILLVSGIVGLLIRRFLIRIKFLTVFMAYDAVLAGLFYELVVCMVL